MHCQICKRKSIFTYHRFIDLILALSVDGSIRLPIKFEPTYQLAPIKPFVPRRVKPILEEVSEGIIDRTFKRSANIDPCSLTKTLSNDVRVTLKGLGPPRYFSCSFNKYFSKVCQWKMLLLYKFLWASI